MGEGTRLPVGTVIRLGQDVFDALCHTAIEAWRLERLVSRLCAEDQIRVRASVDRLTADLKQAGIIVEDFTGRLYVDGMSVEVLVTEDRGDLPSGVLRMVETVRPSVYLGGQLVIQGQIVLGRGMGGSTQEEAYGPRND